MLLAKNEPVDPNDPDAWRTADEHAQAVLRRHGITLNPRHLTLEAIQALTDGQARADTDAGLDWTRITEPASRLDEKLRRAQTSSRSTLRPGRVRRCRSAAPCARHPPRSARRAGR